MQTRNKIFAPLIEFVLMGTVNLLRLANEGARRRERDETPEL